MKTTPSTYLSLLGLFMLFVSSASIAQSSVEVRLSVLDQRITSQHCMAVELYSADEIHLAGQNYRMYYDADKATFNPSSLRSLLPDFYGSATLNEHIYDADASEYGSLVFDKHLGFINFYVDLDEVYFDRSIMIGEEWTPVAQFCFDSEEDVDVSFARRGITDTYATAFVEVSEVIDLSHAESVDLAFNNNISNSDSEKSFSDQLSKVFPNPFEETFQFELSRNIRGSEGRLEVYNVYGSLVKEFDFTSSDKAIAIDLTGYLSGTYIIKVLGEDGAFLESIKATKLN